MNVRQTKPERASKRDLAAFSKTPDIGNDAARFGLQVFHGRVLFADHQCSIKTAVRARFCLFHRTLHKYSSAIHPSTHAYMHTYCGRINIDNLFTDKLSTDDKKRKQSPSERNSSYDKDRPAKNKLNYLHSLSCRTLVIYQIAFQCLTVLSPFFSFCYKNHYLSNLCALEIYIKFTMVTTVYLRIFRRKNIAKYYVLNQLYSPLIRKL